MKIDFKYGASVCHVTFLSAMFFCGNRVLALVNDIRYNKDEDKRLSGKRKINDDFMSKVEGVCDRASKSLVRRSKL